MTKRTTKRNIRHAVQDINLNASGTLSRYRRVFHFYIRDYSQMYDDHCGGALPYSYHADNVEDAQTRDAQLAIALLLANGGSTETVNATKVSRVIKAMPNIVGVYYLSDSLDALYVQTTEDGESKLIMDRGGSETKKAWVGRLQAFALAMQIARADR